MFCFRCSVGRVAMVPQVLTGCSREPYDWLAGEDLLVYRKHDSTREVGPIEVRLRHQRTLRLMWSRCHCFQVALKAASVC